LSAYLRNAWYVAAWADEVKQQILPRRLLGVPVILFRTSNGEAAALLDRCPHRFAPLRMGKLVGDAIQCGYHGLQFNSSGVCVHNPQSGKALPRAAVVPAFPLVEKYSLLWIWMGDPLLAHADLIPDFSFQDPEHFVVGKRYLHVRANYLLEVDNIMDLSHIQFVHASTLGTSSVADAETEVVQNGDTIWSKRTMRNEILPDFLYRIRNIPKGTLVNRWIDVRWDAPASMALFAGAVPATQPRNDEVGVSQGHLFTPETATTTHYWFGIAFPKRLGDLAQSMAEDQIAGLQVPFESEDLPMLEAQQQSIGNSDFDALKPVLLPGDAAAARARRTLQKKIEAEADLLAKGSKTMVR
jgi:phenylpropionate dioxygenase-like ring-hydroxylating dioxygenase large terminal subunit